MIILKDKIETVCFNCIDVNLFRYRYDDEDNGYKIYIDFGNSSALLFYENEDDFNKNLDILKKGMENLWNKN